MNTASGQEGGFLLSSIQRMTEAVSAILNGGVHSVWLYGSVVFRDFQLGWSDVDWIVFAEDEISEAQARELLTLRQALSSAEPDNPYYRCFEGVIARLEEFRSGAFRRLVYWGTSGQRILDRYEMDAFSRYELAKYGRSVLGADDRSIFGLPGKGELAAAVRKHYDAIRKYAVRTDESLYSCGWLLDIARCVYTLRHQDVIAKTQAGLWALETQLFPEDALLRKTLEIRRDPLSFRDRGDVRLWLRELGPVIQRYADVLERELALYPA